MKLVALAAMAGCAAGYTVVTEGNCDLPVSSAAECSWASHLFAKEEDPRFVNGLTTVTAGGRARRENEPAGCYLRGRSRRGVISFDGRARGPTFSTEAAAFEGECSEVNPCICKEEDDAYDGEYWIWNGSMEDQEDAFGCTPILTAEDCEEAAHYLGISRTVPLVSELNSGNPNSRNHRTQPPNCFTNENQNRVTFDVSDPPRYGSCSETFPCVCRKRTAQPTTSPTLSPTPSWREIADCPVDQEECSCQQNIDNKMECIQAAEYLLGYDFKPVPNMLNPYVQVEKQIYNWNKEPIEVNDNPPYCYMEGNVLHFNEDGSNKGDCRGERVQCVCRQ